MFELLKGVRVIDLTRLLPGGVATAKLADLGADVIKVEAPPLGDYLRLDEPAIDGVGHQYKMLNRNKRSIGLDFRTVAGAEVLRDLIRSADVFMEGSLPGAMAKYGLDFDSVAALRPGIVYCSVSGYGQTGPMCSLPSHGLAMDAAAGLMTIVWDDDGRPHIDNGKRITFSIDHGGVNAALTVAAALVHSARSGQSQYLDASCWEAAVSVNRDLQREVNRDYLDEFPDGDGVRVGPRHDVYATKDDEVLFFCPLERRFWAKFCAIVERPEWADRGTWEYSMDYGDDDPTLGSDVAEVLRTRTAQEWMSVLLPHGVPVAHVLTTRGLAEHPHVAARGLLLDDEEAPGRTRYIGYPSEVNGDRSRVVKSPPVLGQHTDEVLADLGYDEKQRARLRVVGITQVSAQGRDLVTEER